VDIEMTITPGDLTGESAAADAASREAGPWSGADGGASLGSASGATLVALSRAGDPAAANELANRFTKPAYLVALQLLGNPEDARDAAQNALMRFFSRLDRLEPGRPIRPWLFTIVRNAALDLARRRTVRRSDSLDEAREEFGTEVIDQSADPEADRRRHELRRDIWRALGRLTQKEREILVLRDYQDLTYAEIAAVLSVPIGTVMSRLHRARRSLRGLLEADYGPRSRGPGGGGHEGPPDGRDDRGGGDHA
jgi:RNA polymerase sigma-70 factor (ECF subfamily)